MGKSFLEVTDVEINTGLSYAYDTYKVRLGGTTLQRLANCTRMKMSNGYRFPVAYELAFREHGNELGTFDRENPEHDGYKRAIAKILSTRRSRKPVRKAPQAAETYGKHRHELSYETLAVAPYWQVKRAGASPSAYV